MKAKIAKKTIARTDLIICHLNSSRCSKNDISVLERLLIENLKQSDPYFGYKLNVHSQKIHKEIYLTILQYRGNLIRISVCEFFFINLGTNVFNF